MRGRRTAPPGDDRAVESTTPRQPPRRHDRSGQWRHRAARRNFRKRHCSNCCGVPARRAAPISRLSSDASPHLRTAASTIISAAASRAIRSTSAGSSRISRRCSTTTRNSSTCWPSPRRASKALYRAARAGDGRLARARDAQAEGAFSASLDADSEGEEGKFYVWSIRRDRRCWAPRTPNSSPPLRRHEDGNFEGHNILNRLSAGARRRREHRLAPLRAKLLARRAARVRPGLDDKVLADWNGLMIAALVNAGLSSARPGWIDGKAPSTSSPADEGRRPARPFLAARPALSRTRIGLRRDDPRRAGALRASGRRRIWSRRCPGSVRSIATMPMRRTGRITSPPPTPRAGHPPGLYSR